jgi:hypothetical protein
VLDDAPPTLADHVFVLAALVNGLPPGWLADRAFNGGQPGPRGPVSVDLTVATGDRYRVTIERITTTP